MSKYHDRTLNLLGPADLLLEQETPRLVAWGNTNSVQLPGAYVEWARLDRLGVLQKCGDRDAFFFDEPRIVKTPQGASGLLFHEGRSGDFQKIVLLGQGDDPPVMYSCKGKPPWIIHTERFSDCVFAQVFDWQYLLNFDPSESKRTDLAGHGDISLKDDACLAFLRGKFEETVKTRIADEREIYNQYRFFKTGSLRLTATVSANGRTHIRITGAAEPSVRVENELFDAFGAEVITPTFNSLTAAVNHLGVCAQWAQFAKLKRACLQPPTADAIERLCACHASLALSERHRPNDFPMNAKPDTFEIGGRDWDINIRFRRMSPGAWCVESIT